MSLSQGKTLGQIGSILVFIPFVNIVGYILLLIAINDISNGVQNRSIFNNAVIAIVIEIVGVALGLSLIVAGSLTSVFTAGMSAVAGTFAGLAVVWVMLVVAALFFRRSYNDMGSSLGVGQFRTTGTLYLVGAALTIVFVGIIIIFVAYIFQAIAYFSIPEQPGRTFQSPQPPVAPSYAPSMGAPAPAPTQASAPVSGTQSTTFCPSCGAPNTPSARFCVSCGHQLNPI